MTVTAMNKSNLYFRRYEKAAEFALEAGVPSDRIVKKGNGWAVLDAVPHLGGSIEPRRPTVEDAILEYKSRQGRRPNWKSTWRQKR